MKVIQVGVGGFGGYWLRMLNEYPGIELAAIVDVDSGTIDEGAQVSGLSPQACFKDLNQALDEVAADALVCVSPPLYHRAHTIAAMEAGLDVICEKPVAVDIEDARAMAQTARDTGRTMAVSQNYRYRPVTWTMQRYVAAGELGALGQISLDFYKGWFFDSKNFRRTMDHVLLSDMSIHHFDLMRFISGLQAVSVKGESWNPPWSKNSGDTSVSLTFTLENGARFVYTASWCAQGDFSDWNGNWLLEGDQGSLHYRDGALHFNYAPKRYQAQESRSVIQVGPPLLDQAYVLADFMAAREEKRQPLTSIFDNLSSLAMVAAARKAVRKDGAVEIPTFEEMMS